MTRKLSTALFTLIALTALLAAGCSSGGDDEQAAAPDGQSDAGVASVDGYGGSTSEGDGGAAVAQPGRDASPEVVRVTSAAARTAELESYQFAMEFGMEGLPDLPGTMVFSAEGAVDAVNERLQMRLDMNAIFDVVPAGTSAEELELMRALLGDGIIEFISDGDTVYLHWSLFTNLFGTETEWVSFADDSSDALSGFSGGLGVDQFAMGPDSFLGYFDGVGSIEERGPAVIRGVATTHYVGTLDLAKATSSRTRRRRRSSSSSSPTSASAPSARCRSSCGSTTTASSAASPWTSTSRSSAAPPRASSAPRECSSARTSSTSATPSRSRCPGPTRSRSSTARACSGRGSSLAERWPEEAPAQATTSGTRNSDGVRPAWCETCCSASREALAGW